MESSKKLQELVKMKDDGVTTDKELYAEQRSNILLISGEHYAKKNWKWINHVRENAQIDDVQKIRLTRNHISRIYKSYVNKFVAVAPGTSIGPQNEKELKDQKSAELADAVWKGIKYRHKYQDKVQDWAGSFIGHGEIFVKIFWDWEKGEFKKNVQQVDEMGEVVGEMPHWTGDLVYEEIFGFDLFRPKECKNLDDAPWLGYQKMVLSSILKERYKDDEVKLKGLEPDGKTTFLIFEDSGYKDSKDTVVVNEVYYRPSFEYPKGYYYLYTNNVILEEGELPEGIFPIRYCLFDKYSTNPRGHSHIKQLKPYQVELNRVGSKMAEHQITLGDDKLIMSHGGKMSAGGNLAGVRAISVTGQNPMVIPGRTGEQYLPYANQMVQEMYSVAMLSEELDFSAPAAIDPYALMHTSSRWKTHFALHTARFERFLCDITETSLDIYRAYIEDDTLVYDIGKGEIINIPEFKNNEKLCYQIKVDPQSDDLETRLGKKMSIDRYIQYSSGNLQKEDLGKFLRLDPYLNKEQMFNDFTTEYDNSTNDILAMDRGEVPVITMYKYKDPGYPVQKFTARMSQADFQYLPPNVQGIYQNVVGEYQKLIEKKIQDTAALNSQFIPSGGALVRMDMWVPDPKDPSKQVRASAPAESIQWLVDHLAKQGSTQEMLGQQRQNVLSDMVQNMRQQVPQQSPTQQPGLADQLRQRLQQMPR